MFKLLVTKNHYNYYEYAYGKYRRGKFEGGVSSTISFDTRKEANKAFNNLLKEDDTDVIKLY